MLRPHGSIKRIELEDFPRYVDGMVRHPLDLELLRTFVAVAESGNFSNAAPRVGRSQSAVSMQMQRLEEELGRPLLVRMPRSVVPNAAGNDLLLYARRLLKLSDEARAVVSRPEDTGTVRLGVPDDYAAFLLPPVLARFAEDHPHVNVELVCEPSRLLVAAVEEGRVDLAIVTRLPSQPFEVLRKEQFVWVAASNHVAWSQDPLPVALFEPGCAARMNVINALSAANRGYRSTYSSASLLGLCAVVQAGLAVAGLAASSVPPTLRVVGKAEGLPALEPLDMSLIRSAASTTAVVSRLDDFLRRILSGP
ncbi:LysR substrate-binding domain-containing protein [Myxococcus sp. K15C18031901]|uniref:LysR substrate-binding domain-containing protein n=1 Tax=Myxococcus dinghuensis TaxID=2906761 RepID=UPI0020A740ED|nr:LysR substrate-binding domain-containing protein [Myxococcus dinghuensis]MCP3098485.1 LysR substrate-binding domain-containing protein [Myxococcus dinghuensis]